MSQGDVQKWIDGANKLPEDIYRTAITMNASKEEVYASIKAVDERRKNEIRNRKLERNEQGTSEEFGIGEI